MIITPALSSRPVADFPSAEVADAVTKAFEGYIIPLVMTAQTYERRMRSENLDPFASRLYYSGDTLAAVILIARRGWTSRVAAMAVAPAFRGQGVGRRVMQEAIDEARDRGERALLLEVIEGNTAAANLYTGLGFEKLHRLVGYRHQGQRVEGADTLVEIDPLRVARIVTAETGGDLPWMLAGETLAAMTPPAKAYRLKQHAYTLISNPEAETVAIYSLIVARASRRQGWGGRLLRALSAQHPDKTWLVPPIMPEALAADFFKAQGWEEHEISQFEMRLDLG